MARFAGVDGLKRRDVRALATWAFARDPVRLQGALAGTASPSAWGHARRRIRRALAAAHASEALDLVLASHGGVEGWDVEVATMVLASCRPEDYAALDTRRFQALEGLSLLTPRQPGRVEREDWLPYLQACRRLTRLTDLSLRDVQRALWAAADGVGELPERRPPRAVPGASGGRRTR